MKGKNNQGKSGVDPSGLSSSDFQAVLRVLNTLRKWRDEKNAKNEAEKRVKSSGKTQNPVETHENPWKKPCEKMREKPWDQNKAQGKISNPELDDGDMEV